MKVRWSARAERDLVQIADYVALDDIDAAIEWSDKLRDRARRAASMPRAGRIVPESGRDDVREVFLHAYRIIYRIEPTRLVVLAVLEGHRRDA